MFRLYRVIFRPSWYRSTQRMSYALSIYRSVSGSLSVPMGKTKVDHSCCDVTRPEVMLWVSVITAGIDGGPGLICGLIL
jgi:hypothetical protein